MPDAVHYNCRKIATGFAIDGNVNKPVWQQAEKTARFVDMVSGEPGLYSTFAAALWSDEHLYIAFWAQEPFVAATQHQRDSIVFLENDLEVFIDGGDCYYELEVNALNTVYEVFFIWKDAYKKGSRFDVPLFDVFADKAMTFAGDYDRTGASFWYGRHPRGLRWAFLNYDMPGLQTAVQVNGKINNPTYIDEGWSLEIAIPWKSLGWLANGRTLPPTVGDTWRIFLGRFQKILASGMEIQPHPAWVMSPHDVYDTHLPEKFPYFHMVL